MSCSRQILFKIILICSVCLCAGCCVEVREQRDEHPAVQLQPPPLLATQLHGRLYLVSAFCWRERWAHLYSDFFFKEKSAVSFWWSSFFSLLLSVGVVIFYSISFLNLFYSLVKSFRHKSSVLISMKYFVLVNFSPFVNPVGGPRKLNFKIPRIVSSPVPDEKITEINILIL